MLGVSAALLVDALRGEGDAELQAQKMPGSHKEAAHWHMESNW